jgi:hypothetical protein
VKRPTHHPRHAGIGISLLILGALAGCDNVGWGGADVAVVPPPPRPSGGPAQSEEEVAAAEALPTGAVLFYAARSGTGALLTPVAQLDKDSLIPIRPTGDPRTFADRFVAEQMRQGAEFDLFSNGTRLGSFVVQSARVPDADLCPLLPVAQGTLELGVAADSVREFLALAKHFSPSVGTRVAASPANLGRMRFVAPILAERMLRVRGAQLPGNWQGAMEQVFPFPASGRADAGFAATFLVGDTLGPGLDDTGYGLFFLAMPTASQTGWDTVYVDFRDYPRTRKSALRVIDYLDWTRDDQVELLLQVYGTRDTWFEAVARDDAGRWRRVLNDRCADGGRPTLLPPMPAGPARPPGAMADTTSP